jgi:predicted Zn-dependent protease
MQVVSFLPAALGGLLIVLSHSGVAPAQTTAELAAKSERATQAMNDGRFDEAADVYREMLKGRPDDPGLLMNLGMALAMAGREPDAIDPLQRAIKLRPTLVPAHLFLGSSYLAIGQADQAVAPLERAAAARPKDVATVALLAQAHLATGHATRAATAFRTMSELAPLAPAGWYGLGQAYNMLVQETLASFESEPEGSPWRLVLLGDALREDNRDADAFGAYKGALQSLAWMRSLNDAIVSIYEKAGRAEWAATARARAAAVPLDCVAHRAECDFRAQRFRSVLATTAGKKDQESRYWRVRAANALARAAFTKLDGLPDSRERREMRAELARAEGRHADSVKEIQAALTFTPDDTRLLEELATSHYLSRDYERTLATIEPLIAADPRSPSLLALKGEALLELQRLDEALPALKQALELDASDAAARTALGRAYVMKGDFQTAIPLLEPSLADDEDGSLHFQLARAYQGTGQAEKAKPLLEKYQQLQQAAQQRAAGASDTKLTPP